jgi:hypothetical protein
MMEAVCAELRGQAKSLTDAVLGTGDLAQAARLMQALAQLHWLQRKPAEAERLHRECLAAGFCLDQDASLRASLGIAAACARQGKREEAREAYRFVLLAAAELPRNHPTRLSAASGLALECWAAAEYVEADRLAEEGQTDCVREKHGPALCAWGLLRLEQGRAADAERLLRMGVDALRAQSGEWSPLLPWHPDTLEAMSGVAAAVEALGRRKEAEVGLRGVLALSERFLGAEHADTRAIRGRFAALVSGGRSDAAGDETGVSLGAGRLVERESQPALHAPDQQQTTPEGVAAATSGGVLDALWQELPCLLKLQELQLRKVEGLDRRTCDHLAVKALGTPGLRRLDLR